MPRNSATISKRTRNTKKKLDESLPPKSDWITKVTSARMNGKCYVFKNGEPFEVKEK